MFSFVVLPCFDLGLIVRCILSIHMIYGTDFCIVHATQAIELQLE